MLPAMGERYRCSACGNLTRFDVVVTRTTRAFHHFSVGGDLSIEDETVLDEHVEEIVCRWCAATGSQIERLDHDVPVPEDVGVDAVEAAES
jgi:hypothetical protein